MANQPTPQAARITTHLAAVIAKYAAITAEHVETAAQWAANNPPGGDHAPTGSGEVSRLQSDD